VAVSRDGGQTWGSLRRAEELITPRCHGAVERYDKNRLLFSSPASNLRREEHPYGRTNLTVRAICDSGATWGTGRTIWPHPSSYSDIAVLDDGTVGLVYERGDKGSTHYWDELHFVRFNLEWLTWNAPAMKIANDPAAQRLLKRTYRKGWQVAGL
jgi:sialidase-1